MMDLAEDELNNLAKVWASVLGSLTYCYFVGKFTPNGFPRLVPILPIIFLFIILPLKLTSLHFCGFTGFFISWLANFKLLLFAFGKPPLSSHSLSLPRFLALASLPIKIKIQSKKHNPTPQKSHFNYYIIVKGALLALIFRIYNYSLQIPQKLLWIIYFLHIYFTLEITLALFAKSVESFLGLEVEPQFNEPLLSTSLQDFWGRRWNLMVTSILRPTVYQPTLDHTTGILGPHFAKLLAVMGTFVVSALMHELIFFYLGRVKPTFEVTCFFLLHGLCLCLEIVAKRWLQRNWRVPWWVSGPVTTAIVVATAFWLFLPPLLRAGLDGKGLQEYASAAAFLRRVIGRSSG